MNFSGDVGDSEQEGPFRPDKPRTVDRCRMRPQNRPRFRQPRRLQQHRLVRPYCFQRMRRGRFRRESLAHEQSRRTQHHYHSGGKADSGLHDKDLVIGKATGELDERFSRGSKSLAVM
jgi:hypothetical protein